MGLRGPIGLFPITPEENRILGGLYSGLLRRLASLVRKFTLFSQRPRPLAGSVGFLELGEYNTNLVQGDTLRSPTKGLLLLFTIDGVADDIIAVRPFAMRPFGMLTIADAFFDLNPCMLL